MKNIGKSRRLRKKLRLGEFQELGFEFYFEFTEELDETINEDGFDAIDDFLETFDIWLDTRNLSFTGVVATEKTTGFINAGFRQSTTEDDRKALFEWLCKYGNVHNIDIGPLEDAWHDRPSFNEEFIKWNTRQAI